MRKQLFQGTYTAIVTPFDRAGQVDYAAFRRLVTMQISAGVDGIVPVGTTGESPTVTMEEHCRLIDISVEAARGRIQVIAGTGANSTEEALYLTRHALKAGADGSLQVTPYYNKPSDEGLVRHFSATADVGLPVMLYNVPSRTSREISVPVLARLARHPRIVCVKEAGGSVDRVSHILRACDITVLSGDDSLTLPMMAVGARGVVSVASNVAPRAVVSMVRAALDGDFRKAGQLHRKLHRLFCDLFIETNPIPVKAAMAMMGLIEETYRLPLCAMGERQRSQLAGVLRELKLVR